MNTMFALVATLLLALPAASAPLRIVAATNDLAAIARAVGGDDVTIEVVARPDRDPHSLPVLPSTMRSTAKADVYLEVGLSLDLWSQEIVRGSRNRDLVVVDCSRAVAPLEIPSGAVDVSQGDVHPDGNPHYWLDPLDGAAVADLLAREFGARDAAHAAAYAAGAATFRREIEERMPGWDARLRGASFVEFHRSWVYLATRFGMDIVGRVEPLPGIPPSARHLADLAAHIRETRVPVVIRDPYHDKSSTDFLAREADVRSVVLSTSCAEPTPASYLAHFDEIASVLGRVATESQP
jgi:zinc/manganese transport system substrate-binding protein